MIRYARQNDFEVLSGYDRHIAGHELRRGIAMKRVLVLYQEESFAGWLRYNLFWDEIPFLNMLYLLEGYRGLGLGGRLLQFWEREMAEGGCQTVLASTLSSERGQFFFRKRGYTDCGALLLPGEALEIILQKRLPGSGNPAGNAQSKNSRDF